MSTTPRQERHDPPQFDPQFDPPQFEVVPDDGVHPAVMLDRPLCVIGRDYDANLPLHGPQVSRHHALVVRDGSRVYVRDLASKNATLHNGEPVVEANLNDGDELRLGSFTLRCAAGFGGGNDNGQSDSAGDAQEPIGAFHLGGRIVPIPDGRRTFVIGRRTQCDLTVDDPSVAEAHAVIFTMDGRHHVRDLNTQGRTVLNDVAVHKGALNDGDLLKIGSVTVEYHCEGAAAPAAATSGSIEPVQTAQVADPVAEPLAEEEAATPEPTPLASLDELGALDMPAADDIAGPARAEVDAAVDVPEPGGADSMIPLADESGAAAKNPKGEDSIAGAPATAEPTRARSQEPPPGVDAAERSWSGSESAIPFALDDEDGQPAAAPSPRANQKPARGRDDWKKQGSPSPRPIPRGARLD